MGAKLSPSNIYLISFFAENLSKEEIEDVIKGHTYCLSDIKLFASKISIEQKRSFTIGRCNTNSLRVICKYVFCDFCVVFVCCKLSLLSDL
jgi:hypothetical protein